MEITVDGARVLASTIPVALLIIAIHTRGLRRRIRLVPKRFALVATIAIIFAAIVAVGLCVWCSNTGEPLDRGPCLVRRGGLGAAGGPDRGDLRGIRGHLDARGGDSEHELR